MSQLLLSEIFPPRTGGSGRWFWETYRRLPREEYSIAAGRHAGADSFDSAHDLRIHRLPLTLTSWGIRSFAGLKGYCRAIWNLRSVVRRDHVNLIHVGRCLPEGVIALGAKWWFNLPFVCYIHGEDISTALDSREHTMLVRRVLNNATFLIANSHNTAAMLRETWGIDRDKIHVLHPGVDTNYFSPATPDSVIRASLRWTNRRVVLTVGRLQRRKGHDMMIRALPIIRRVVPDVLYAIAGDGAERDRLQQLAREEDVTDYVQFLGEISDEQLLQCYRQCNLFALPNRQDGTDIEGFGMVLLEAQACGKAVLAGDSGGTAETMQVNQTGRIVDCTQPQSLADAVSELLLDDKRRNEMGQEAREWVVDQFDWDSLSRRAERLFMQALEQKTSNPIVQDAVA